MKFIVRGAFRGVIVPSYKPLKDIRLPVWLVILRKIVVGTNPHQ